MYDPPTEIDPNAPAASLTVRGMIAAMVMQGILAGHVTPHATGNEATASELARLAVADAEALITALNEPEKKA